jgi:hypothetical protein
MKTSRLIMSGVAMAVLTVASFGQVFTASLQPDNQANKLIPDSPGSMVSSYITVAGMPVLTGSLTYDVDVWMRIDKVVPGTMYNSDYFATLVDVTRSKSVVLLNRVGRSATLPNGYGDAGFNVWFSAGSANGNIHTYQDVTGPQPAGLTSASRSDSWTPDGRATDPRTALTSDPVTQTLSSMYSQNVNGDWVLGVQDFSGGGSATLTDWSVGFTAVPEPSEYAMVAGLALIGFAAARRLRTKTA